ncbi:MAG: flippase, partial [bacterium]
ESPSLVSLIVRALFLLFLVYWLMQGMTLGAAISMQLVAEAIGVVLLLFLAARRGYPLRPRANTQLARTLVSQSWPIAASSAFVMIYTKIDVLILQALRGSQEVGYYSVSMRLVDALAIVPSVFMVAVFPILSHTFRLNQQNFIKWVRISFRLLLAVILPITVIVTFYAAEIIRILYGTDYAPSAPVLRILIWAGIAIYGGLVFDGALVASGRQKIGTALYAGMAVINVALNLMLIPHLGIVGAAWATAISYILWAVCAVFIAAIRPIGVVFWRELMIPLVIAFLLGATAYYFDLPLWLACLWEVIGFYSGLFLTGVLRTSDLKMIRGIFLKSRDENSAD